jgi:peptidoglycan/xylan/chitin deacetylase (PgdA/CDA1 family)
MTRRPCSVWTAEYSKKNKALPVNDHMNTEDTEDNPRHSEVTDVNAYKTQLLSRQYDGLTLSTTVIEKGTHALPLLLARALPIRNSAQNIGTITIMPFKLILAVAMVAIAATATGARAGEIALTFDDAPMGDSPNMTGQARTRMLLSSLKAAGVDQALFFVTTKHIDKIGSARLKEYTASGHFLAHHSHSHQSASKLSSSDYMADFKTADSHLQAFDQVLKLHRFPYLHYGADEASVANLQKAIKEQGYRDGYVTIDTADWYLNSLIVEAASRGEVIDTPAIREFYVNNLWESIVFYDTLAQQAIGRSPKHVLLLHENDAAALFVDDLVKKIREEGWKVVTPAEAYADPIAQSTPNTIYNKQGRIAALAYQAGIPVEELKSPAEDLDAVKQQFEAIFTSGE